MSPPALITSWSISAGITGGRFNFTKYKNPVLSPNSCGSYDLRNKGGFAIPSCPVRYKVDCDVMFAKYSDHHSIIQLFKPVF